MADEEGKENGEGAEAAVDGDSSNAGNGEAEINENGATAAGSGEEKTEGNSQEGADPSAVSKAGLKTINTDVQALMDVDVEITAVLGTAKMQISQILKLGRGAVVELDRLVGEDIEINANNRLVAKGEVIVIEDKLGVTVTNTVKMTE
ncbi:MAG: flagellar motor switch protein FliN [Magnetovibrio sp.]|nr:flagellar motor switch protein FliN [Magnetovibrio sp.]